MKRILIFCLFIFLAACKGQVNDATNPQAAQSPDDGQSYQTSYRTHPADAAITLGSLAVAAASNWTDPIGSLASLDIANGYTKELALASTDGSDTILRSFYGLIFAINRYGTDTVQVFYPNTFGIVANYSVENGSNPQDLWMVSHDKVYISRMDAQNDTNNADDILIMDPLTGAHKGSIDLKPHTLDDGDRLARAAQMVLVDDMLFVCMQDLPTNLLDPANANGKVAVIDITTDSVAHVIELTGRNPADITYSPLTDLIYVSLSGVFDDFDTDVTDGYGGIEVIDPNTLQSQGIMIDDADLGGYPSEIRLASEDLGFVIVDGLHLASFDPTSYEVLDNRFYTSDGYYLPDFSIEESGNLLITERSSTDPGILILDSNDGSTIAGPIPVGAPPASVVFVDIN